MSGPSVVAARVAQRDDAAVTDRQPDAADRERAFAIGRAAVGALYDELSLAPKPGLVSFVDSGSHTDMDAHTFLRSLFALRGYFVRIAALGAVCAPFAALEQAGIEAEARMRAATGGVNTHRGAIFGLGLVCAAAGACGRETGRVAPARLRSTLLDLWGPALAARCARVSTLPGGIAARRYGLRSASAEAAAGFPGLFEQALPALRAARARGLDARSARIDTFFALLAVLDDSNLAHRGGLDGLRQARALAAEFVAAGGIARPDGPAQAWAIHRQFVARRWSPGGCADLLAATMLVDRLTSGSGVTARPR